jgi:hypothetical protein
MGDLDLDGPEVAPGPVATARVAAEVEAGETPPTE